MSKYKKTNIENFRGISVEIDGLVEDIDKEADRVVQQLKTQPQWKHNRRTRRYNNGWVKRFTSIPGDSSRVQCIIWNATDWQLTWLLENGHLIVNKHGGVGWAAPHKHIAPAADKGSERLVKDCKKAKVKVYLK